MRPTLLALAIVLTPNVVVAQAVDSRLTARLDPATARAVAAVVDSATAEGLPSEPIIQKALEGAVMHASSERILQATRGLRTLLRSSREQLGANASSAELVAGAAALRSGIAPGSLAALRQARPGRSVAIPLGVLSNLVGQGVGASRASESVLTLARRGASDSDFLAFEDRVQNELRAGRDPGLVPVDPTASGAPRQ